jgi:hypothetical protein
MVASPVIEEVWHCGMMYSRSYEALVPWKDKNWFHGAKLTGICDWKLVLETHHPASSTISKFDDDLCTYIPLNILIGWRLAILAGWKLGSWQHTDLRGICGREKVTLKLDDGALFATMIDPSGTDFFRYHCRMSVIDLGATEICAMLRNWEGFTGGNIQNRWRLLLLPTLRPSSRDISSFMMQVSLSV